MSGSREDFTAAAQDFTAALHEIESNLEVRRLMIVVIHILVPALAMAVVNAATGDHYPESLVWLPANVLWIVGAVLVLGGVITGVILSRCHFGMVVNGAKLTMVADGGWQPRPLNWLGVTTNFLAINALAAGGGAALVGLAVGLPILGIGVGLGLAVLLMLVLQIQHERASRLVLELGHNWPTGEVPPVLREEHLRKSLDATSADIAVVVTMAAALFAGTFDAMTNLGALNALVLPAVATADLQTGAMVALAAFTLLSLLLSARIVVRLRIALAEHSMQLARLRDEPDRPWRFRPFERTFLLFALVMSLAIAVAMIGCWTVAGPLVAGVAGLALAILGALWYPLRLRAARPADHVPPGGSVGAADEGTSPSWWRRES